MKVRSASAASEPGTADWLLLPRCVSDAWCSGALTGWAHLLLQAVALVGALCGLGLQEGHLGVQVVAVGRLELQLGLAALQVGGPVHQGRRQLAALLGLGRQVALQVLAL